MDVPVVAAAGFKGDVERRNLLHRHGFEITLTDKILRKSVVRLADGQRQRGNGIVLLTVDLGNQRECAPSLGPAAVERKLCYDFHGFLFRNAVLLAQRQMRLELRIQARREESRDGDHTSVPRRKLFFTRPYLAEKDVIVQLREFRSELSKVISASRLLFHMLISYSDIKILRDLCGRTLSIR